ncbi:hypothetical protein KFK09_029091 [Dendrobium nobile]|uniref:Major facilitator superfamily (MFS) profile domain-containing protein n=1 Tax=Dendrobium nobile TaxID=94219 RepID=A0A8T3A593_DENNO|nr:hypothetical protein KFK09_029091 [Dendrobium nobile]
MTSSISDPEQPQISFFSRLSKQHHTEIDKDDTREPLIDGDSSNQSFSLSAAILPFFFPALGGLLYGYDIGATSGATISLESATLSGTTWYNLNSLEIGLVVSGSLYGALIGSSFAFTVADYLGRRRELIFASIVYFVGSLLTAVAPNFPVMVIGRLLFGIGIGLCGYISSSLFVDIVAGWRYIYAIGAPVCLVMGVGMWWLPPSPRWLLLCTVQGKVNISDVRTTAISCLCRLRGQAIDDTASEEIDAILHELSLDDQHKQATFFEIFQGKCLKALIIGVGLLFFQQVTGQPSVLYYAAKILQSAGFSAASDATRVSVLLGILKLFATGVAILAVDRLGRRPLLLGGVSGIAFSLFLLSLYYTILKDLPVVAVIALLLYVGSYQLSFGPIGWLMISEIFPLRIRGRGLSIAVLANFATNALVTFAFSPLQELVGAGILFAAFGVIALLSLVFIFLLVPETKGLTLEEIEAKIL